jgi:23S rRNA (pseudouridine1915-N3)-methyltransferase
MSTMFKISCVVVSQPTGEWEKIIQHYSQLLRGRVKLEHHYCCPERFSTASQRQTVLKVEAEKLRQRVQPDSVVIACTERGKMYTSVEFAKHLLRWSMAEQQILTFVLGGPLGLDEQFERAAQQRLALSTLTLPHDLAHVVLLEQIYRATTLLTGKTYHY